MPNPLRDPKMRLFCFPYAGGSAAAFHHWGAEFRKDIELVVYQPPGRASRTLEAPSNSIDEVMHELLEHAKFITKMPFAFLGHSLGSRIAFELTIRLQEAGLPLPKYFFGSGSRSPAMPQTGRRLCDLPREELLSELKDLNGTPAEILEHPELMELLLPALRADFRIAENHVSKPIKFDIPAMILGGEHDTDVALESLNAWQQLFINEHSEVRCFPGDHFFINEHRKPIISLVQSALTRFIN